MPKKIENKRIFLNKENIFEKLMFVIAKQNFESVN